MQRNPLDPQSVNRPEFGTDFAGRTGHSAEAQVAAEKALVGQAPQLLAGIGQRAAFLGLDHLVQAAFPGAIRHRPSGVGIDNHYLVLVHQIVAILVQQIQCMQRLANQLFTPRALRQRPSLEIFETCQLLLPGQAELDTAVTVSRKKSRPFSNLWASFKA